MDNNKNISASALKIKETIEVAVKSGKISRKDYDGIMHIATMDNHIDPHEKALLTQLYDLIEDKTIVIVK